MTEAVFVVLAISFFTLAGSLMFKLPNIIKEIKGEHEIKKENIFKKRIPNLINLIISEVNEQKRKFEEKERRKYNIPDFAQLLKNIKDIAEEESEKYIDAIEKGRKRMEDWHISKLGYTLTIHNSIKRLIEEEKQIRKLETYFKFIKRWSKIFITSPIIVGLSSILMLVPYFSNITPLIDILIKSFFIISLIPWTILSFFWSFCYVGHRLFEVGELE